MIEHSSQHKDNTYRTVVVSSAEQMAHAHAVRAICFLEERKISYRDEFDGNDFHATHFVMYAEDEPVATCRVRWFADFAKIEATSFREQHRNPRIQRRFARFVFDHVARKGYTTLLTVAMERYARVYEKLLGFKRAPGRTSRRHDTDDVYYELEKELVVPPDAITRRSTPGMIFRQEGAWDKTAAFE